MKKNKSHEFIKAIRKNKKLSVFVVLLVLFVVVGSILVIYQQDNQIKSRFNQQIRGLSIASTGYLVQNFDLYFSSPTLKYQALTNDFLAENKTLENFQIFDTSGAIVFDSSKYVADTLQVGNVDQETLELSRKSELSYIMSGNQIRQVVSPYFEDWGTHRYTILFTTSVAEVSRQLAQFNLEVVIIAFLLAVILAVLGGVFILTEQYRLNKAEKKKLDELDTQRREFLVLAAHNLRTPLTSIKGYLSMLTEAKLTKEQVSLIVPMDEGVEKLSKITENIIAITNVQIDPDSKLPMEKVRLLDIVSEVLERYTEPAESLGVAVSTKVAPSSLTFDTNAKYLTMILDALIGNAIKFNKQGGTVEISAHSVENNIEITVADTGTGIKESEQDNIYTIFHKSTQKNMLVYDYEGAGVGLYMTKLLTEYLGGSIVFESVVKKGTTFTLLFPVETKK